MLTLLYLRTLSLKQTLNIFFFIHIGIDAFKEI